MGSVNNNIFTDHLDIMICNWKTSKKSSVLFVNDICSYGVEHGFALFYSWGFNLY